jgi:hypothetical protein
MNIFYKSRYDKFISIIRNLGERNFDCYTETHHIIPRCLGGSDAKENLIKLTLREHFLAHWLLWKAYLGHLPLASAFLQMNNKNSKTHKPFQGRITSRTYEQLKTQAYKMVSELMTDKVHLKDENGDIIVMTKEQYASQDQYKFHTTGKIYVYDTESNEWVYILSSVYQANKHRYKSRMSLEGFPFGGAYSRCSHNKGGNHNASIDVVFAKYQFIDLETNEILKITKSEARERNKEYGYKRLKHIQKTQNKNIKCIDDLGDFYSVPLKDYDPLKHKFYLAEKVNVFDIVDNKQKIIPLSEYYLNKNRYKTSTKGKVLAKDTSGKNVLVSKDEFDKGNYVGQTKGLRTVKDKDTGLFVQISEKDYLANKQKYVGPNDGRVNVIDKQTGERKQIPKNEFDKTRYSGLGNKKYLFLCRNKLTNKEKYINIFEWNLVKDTYEIIDTEKFQKILDLL